MKIMQIAPEERLPNLLQDPERYGYPNLMVNLPRYRCPHCGEYTVFSVTEPNASPISAGIRAQFDALTDRRSPYEQGVSDFLCRVCAVPVRVVYQINEFQMASYRYFAEAVFETAT